MTSNTGAAMTAAGGSQRADGAVKIYGAGATAVRALDGVSVGFELGRFTGIMGPSGSGESTLLHCMAGLDTLTEGRVYVGNVELGTLRERDLTRLRRDHVGFIFQAFNLVPTLTAFENITLPIDIAGRKPDQAWLDTVIDTIGIRDRLGHTPARGARCNAWRPRARWRASPTSCSPTIRRGTWTPSAGS